MAKVKYRMKDPETWLPKWARGNNLPVLKMRFHGVEHTIPPANANGGYEFEMDDSTPLGQRHIRHMDGDPRFERVV